MKHMRLGLLVVVLFMLLSVACAPVEVEPQVITVTATPRPTGKEEVRFLIQETDPPSVEAYTEMERDFEAEFPEYDVVIEFTNPDAVAVKISSVIAAGGTLDVFQPNPAMAADLATQGQLLSLDGVVDNLGGRDEFFPNTLLEVEDTAYCMPYASGSPVLWYRKDVFEEAGIEPPTTWEEMVAAAEAVNSDEIAGVVLPAGENQFTSIIAQHFLWQAGTEVFSRDGEIKLAGNERAAEALAHYADLLQYAPEGATGYSFFETIDAFTSGRAAMHIYWGRVLGRLYANAPDLVGIVGAVPLPEHRMKVTFADISYNCVYGDTRHPEAARAWVEYMARPEQAVKLLLTVPGHLAPVTEGQREALRASDNQPLNENPDIAEVLFGVNDYAYNVNLNRGGIDEENLEIVPTGIVNTGMATLWSSNALSRAVQEVFVNNVDPMQALEEAQTTLEEALEE